MEEAVEFSVKKGTRKVLGRLMLKGDNISLIQPKPKLELS